MNDIRLNPNTQFLKTTATSDDIRGTIPYGKYSGFYVYCEFDVASASNTALSDFPGLFSIYKNGNQIAAPISLGTWANISNYKSGFSSMSGASATTKYLYALVNVPVNIGENDNAYFTLTNLTAGNSSNVNTIYGVMADQPIFERNYNAFSPSIADKEPFLLPGVKEIYLTATDESKLSNVLVENTRTKEVIINAPFSVVAALSKQFAKIESSTDGCLITLPFNQDVKLTLSVSSSTTATIIYSGDQGIINPQSEPVVPIQQKEPESYL